MKWGKYLGYAISAVILCIIAFKLRDEWGKVAESLSRFDYRVLVPALAIYVAGFMLRAVRWQCMLAPLKRIKFTSSFNVVMIGFMANNILPLRIGEFVRAWALKRKEGVSGSAGFATIVVERVYDGLTLVGLFALVLFFSATSPEMKRYAALSAPVFLAAYGLLLYAAFREEQAARIIKGFTLVLPLRLRTRADSLVDSFMPGLRFLSSWRSQGTVIALSFAIWFMEGCVFWIVMRGFDMATPPYAAFFTLVIVNIAIMVPAGPGYMGTFEAAAVVALAPFHVSDSAAISYILVVHALQYVSVTALGLYFMNASGWSLREIEEAENG
ncbi:MAG: lysylphosphatidylglycerol synthase transmembrane domain-containing protein [Chlamydiota bacterium]